MSKLRFWFTRVVVVVVGLVLLVLLAGAGYEALAAHRYRARGFPGKLVDVGGYRQYIYCAGTGSPTLVFDSGLGDASDVWRDLHPRVTQFSRACVFDRAGLGRSDDGPLPRSSGANASALHALLAGAGEKGPYVLVGHSMAGYDVRIFAGRYPSEVAGVLLLDVSHPDQNQRESAYAVQDREEFMKKQAWFGRLAPWGITRLVLGRCEYHPQDCTRTFRTTLEEFDAFNRISPDQVRAAGNLGSIPLIVLAHDPAVEIAADPSETTRKDEAVDLQMQKELSELSSRGCMLVATRSRHYVQDDRPDLVMASLRHLIGELREPSRSQNLCPPEK
jgi:pimeloyl-ACP methyl ester carboxylesterase